MPCVLTLGRRTHAQPDASLDVEKQKWITTEYPRQSYSWLRNHCSKFNLWTVENSVLHCDHINCFKVELFRARGIQHHFIAHDVNLQLNRLSKLLLRTSSSLCWRNWAQRVTLHRQKNKSRKNHTQFLLTRREKKIESDSFVFVFILLLHSFKYKLRTFELIFVFILRSINHLTNNGKNDFGIS